MIACSSPDTCGKCIYEPAPVPQPIIAVIGVIVESQRGCWLGFLVAEFWHSAFTIFS